jgi:hypothetical protein
MEEVYVTLGTGIASQKQTFCQFSWGTFGLILYVFASKCDFLPEIISENMIFLLIFAAENVILRVRNYYHNEIKYEKKKDMDCCRVSYVLHGSTGARDEGDGFPAGGVVEGG